MNKCNRLLVLPLLLACLSSTVFAGGPLIVAGPSGHTPVVYPSGGTNIILNYDLGPLGSRTNQEADALINQALSLWNNVSTSTVNIAQGADLELDVNISQGAELFNNFSDGINPVIFDTDGEITDALFGVGAKNNILGFAGSAYFTASGIYAEGQAVINGFIDISDSTLAIVFAHEFGHFFGLDHTQLDNNQGLTSSSYPLMYPIAFRNQISLHEDDIASVSKLYPSASFDTTYGTLSGSFTEASSAAIRGANIWVQETATNKVYSTVSDYLININGDFTLNLPPGTYTVHAESIQSNFTGGSSVGPYSETTGDISFLSPHPLTPVNYGGGTLAQVTITAGNTRNINFSLSGVIPVSDDDDDTDGLNNIADNCPAISNADQTNFDGDSEGDVCDSDDDNDTLLDTFEITNGLDPLDATGINGAAGDADGDGFTNFEEQDAGSDASAATGATSNPGIFNFGSATASVNEDAGTGSIDVTRTGGSIGDVTVLCFSTDIASQATAGIDYTSVNSILEWTDGDAANKVCSFSITPDSVVEGNETFQLDLSDPTGGAKLGAP